GEIEPLEEGGDHVGESGGRQIRLWHRDGVRAERPVRAQASVARGGDRRDDLAPEVRVDQQPVYEDHRRALAGVVIPDPPTGHVDLPLSAERPAVRHRAHPLCGSPWLSWLMVTHPGTDVQDRDLVFYNRIIKCALVNQRPSADRRCWWIGVSRRIGA